MSAALALLAHALPFLRGSAGVGATGSVAPRVSELAALLAGSAPVALIALCYHTGDWSAHYWNSAAIAGGALPLAYPSDPALPLPYHYAIDLLAAVSGALLPIDPEWRFDALIWLCWLCASALAAWLVRLLTPQGRLRALGLALGLALLGGGAAWLVAPWTHNEGEALLRASGLEPFWFRAGLFGAFTDLGHEIVNFPALHYFFNPPMALGIPIGLGFAILYTEWCRARRPAALAAAALALASLGLAQVAWLAVLAAAVALHAALDALRGEGSRDASLWQRIAQSVAPGSALLLLAAALAAFAAGGAASLAAGAADPADFAWLRGLRLRVSELPAYYLASFGIPGLLAAPVAVVALGRGGPAGFLACVALVAAALPHVVWYRHSNVDNLKFFCIAGVAFGLLASRGLLALRRALPGRAGAVAVAALLAGSVATPLLHTALRLRVAPDYVLTLVRREVPAGPKLQPLFAELWPAPMRAAAWLREQMGPRELLLVVAASPDPLYVQSVTGRSLADPGYAGYPALALPEAWLRARSAWFERARRFEPAALCAAPAAGLWIYADERAQDAAARAALAAAERAGLLALAHREADARASVRVYRACPSGPPAP